MFLCHILNQMDGHDSQNDFSHSDLVRSNEDEVQVVGETSGTSWYYAVLLTVNAGLGASLLAFPQAYDLAGGIPMSLTFLVVSVLQFFVSLVVCSLANLVLFESTVNMWEGEKNDYNRLLKRFLYHYLASWWFTRL